MEKQQQEIEAHLEIHQHTWTWLHQFTESVAGRLLGFLRSPSSTPQILLQEQEGGNKQGNLLQGQGGNMQGAEMIDPFDEPGPGQCGLWLVSTSGEEVKKVEEE